MARNKVDTGLRRLRNRAGMARSSLDKVLKRTRMRRRQVVTVQLPESLRGSRARMVQLLLRSRVVTVRLPESLRGSRARMVHRRLEVLRTVDKSLRQIRTVRRQVDTVQLLESPKNSRTRTVRLQVDMVRLLLRSRVVTARHRESLRSSRARMVHRRLAVLRTVDKSLRQIRMVRRRHRRVRMEVLQVPHRADRKRNLMLTRHPHRLDLCLIRHQ